MIATGSPASELRALADLINESVKQIETACTSTSQTYPRADEPFTPQSEGIRMNPDVFEAGNIIIAAASQLLSAVRMPQLTLWITSGYHFISSCMRLAIECNISEILREAGPQGLHVKEIAAKTGVDSVKLARCLRLLVTQHIFREVDVDVFSNNRVSSALDTKRPVSELLKSHKDKFDGTTGLAAVLDHVSDEGLKASGWLPEAIMDKEIGSSQEPNEAAFSKAYNTQMPIFSWWELPENAWRIKRLAIGMQGLQSMSSRSAILEGFKWESLPKKSLVVDVGGSVGSQSLALAQKYEHLNFVVQDRETVMVDAEKYWNAHFPEAVEGGRVQFQVHDFFTPQPVKEPAVFLLRMVLHDWSDKYCAKILSELRKAAGPKTQLLVVDYTVEYACEDTTSARNVHGASVPLPPAPLLANKGAASIMRYILDMHVLSLNNGDERTVARFQELFEQCGWKLTEVIQSNNDPVGCSKLIAVPI